MVTVIDTQVKENDSEEETRGLTSRLSRQESITVLLSQINQAVHLCTKQYLRYACLLTDLEKDTAHKPLDRTR